MEALRERDILTIIFDDSWMMNVLQTVQKVNLPDWWIGAGFVRSKVWDYLHGYTKRTPLPDIDVIYFDKKEENPEKRENELSSQLNTLFPHSNFEVINQARTHTWHNDPPYKNSSEALSKWVETATCVGVQLDKESKLQITAPLGIDDLVHCIVRQNPTIPQDKELFLQRVDGKNWRKLWPMLQVQG